MCQYQQQAPREDRPRPTETPTSSKKNVSFGEIQEQFLQPLPRNLHRADLFYSTEELEEQKLADIKTKRDAFQGNDSSDTAASYDPSIPYYRKEQHLTAAFAEDTNDICFRGLEHVLHKTERREHIQSYIKAVLEVHTEQREVGLVDSYELFIVARSHSKADRKHAHRMGKVDAQVASKLRLEMTDASNSSRSLADCSCSSTAASSTGCPSSTSSRRNSAPQTRRTSRTIIQGWVAGTFQRLKSHRNLKSSKPIRRSTTL